MEIGNVKTKSNIFLAPMAGVTDMPFRRICLSYGAGLVCSEMISAKGLYYGDKKTARLMHITEDGHPSAIQIFGSDADIMAEIIPLVMEFSPDIIDINMGCPMPKIVNNGDGSALLRSPEKIGEIIKKISAASPVPVTVKIRSGWDADSINAVETALICEQNGAAAITVHGRTREEYYSGHADWGIIKAVKNAVSIPVIGNGDVTSPEDAERMLAETSCDGVAIGRGAEGNPFIFRQINEYLENGSVSFNPTPREKLEVMTKHIEAIVREKGEYIGIREARKHIAWYIKGMRGASAFKNKVFTITDMKTLRECLSEFIGNL